jgi:glycyl-tRNA synthetase beta subunit
MYLPLTGFARDNKKDKLRMSIDSINSGINNPYFIRAPETTNNVNNDIRKVDIEESSKNIATQINGASENNKNFRRSGDEGLGMSTQDFLSLRGTTSVDKKEDPYAVLDQVIERMKKNIEDLGDALETLKEMSDRSNGSQLALKLLQETFDAMDEIAGGDKLSNLFKEDS